MLAADAPERKGKGGPFINPEEGFVLAKVGPLHVLEFSKYCPYRPLLVLHTREFEPQNDDLNFNDLAAAWALLKHMKEPYLMMYNCGVASGSSQGHKHMQLFARAEIPFEIFPAQAQSTEGGPEL